MYTYNEVINSVIRSKTVLECINKEGYMFSGEDMVTLVCNSGNCIETKIDMLNSIGELVRVGVAELSIYDNDNFINRQLEEVKGKLESIKKIVEFSDDRYVLMITDKSLGYTVIKELSILKNNIEKGINNLESRFVTVVDILTGVDICQLEIDGNCEIIQVYTNSACGEHELMNRYVSIPNNFKVGDVVRDVVSGEKYIVSCELSIPKQLIDKCDFFDCSIEVVPYNVFEDKYKYDGITPKEQVEKIIHNRVKNIDKKDKPDVISIMHEHINVTVLEKEDI